MVIRGIQHRKMFVATRNHLRLNTIMLMFRHANSRNHTHGITDAYPVLRSTRQCKRISVPLCLTQTARINRSYTEYILN